MLNLVKRFIYGPPVCTCFASFMTEECKVHPGPRVASHVNSDDPSHPISRAEAKKNSSSFGTAPSPTSILVELVCQRILLNPRTTDSMCVTNYYESHTFAEGNINLQFMTDSYATNAPVGSIGHLRVKKDDTWPDIKLDPEHHKHLIAALNKGNRLAQEHEAAERRRQNELAACDAIEVLLKIQA